MNILKRTAGFVAGTVRSVGTTVNVLSGGLSIKTEDVPVSAAVLETLSLEDVRKWMKQNVVGPQEPVKVAVVRQRHGQLWKVSFVILNQKNKRCTDEKGGGLRAQAQLVRVIAKELDEFFGSHNSVLLSSNF